MEYAFLLLPITFIALSYYYRTKSVKFRDSGRIPEIVLARRNTTLYIILAVLSVLALVIIHQTMVM